jgi:predicted dehydrogenase
MNTWRVGLVGYGWAAGAHLTALARVPSVEVVAVCTSRQDAGLALAAAGKGAIEIVRDYDELLRRNDIDVVDIASRSDLHATQGIAAARAGKHVIIEKPIALSLADLRDLQGAVAEAGVRTCVGFNERFSEQFTATKRFLDEGLIGPLHYGEVDYYHEVGPSVRQYEWNRLRIGGGSSLLSCGCHSVDGLLWFMGSKPVEVTSYSTGSPNPIFARYEYPTSSVSIIKFENGAVGKVASIIDSYQPYHLRVHLVGSDGAIVDGRFWSTHVAGLDPNEWSDLGIKLETSADVIHHPYAQLFRAFFNALDEDTEMPLTSLTEASKAFELVFAADLSAELGRPIRMDELDAAAQAATQAGSRMG